MANTEKNKPETRPDEFSRSVDKYLLGIYIALLVFSIIESYGASSFEVKADNIFGPLIRHLVTLGIGVLTTVIVSRINYRHIPVLTPLFVFLSAIIVIVVFCFGEVSNDAVRSVSVLGFQLQSSEFVKLSAVLVIALVASKSQDKERKLSKKGVIIISVVVAIFGGALITQGLTNTALLMGISIAMMFLGGIRWKHLGAVGGVYIVLTVIMFGVHSMLKSDDSESSPEQEQVVAVAGTSVPGDIAANVQGTGEKKTVFRRSSTWTKRIEQWKNDTIPMYEQKVTDENRQVFFARMAQGTGNIFGHGPGNSSVTSQLPLANIDYIFSVVVSDLGFAGGFALLLCYLSLLFRAGRIASKCRRAYPAMLIIGMSVFIVFSAMFHMAINTGLFPVSGQPLPLISKGGTSILITSLAFGIMFSVSRTAAMSSKKEENIAEKEMLPDDLQAENPGMLK
ncbi:MAG: FtsW/RodA/SpoVE family cell cycle protein [Bacteroidales bacterium]|nr:FtsW/RodA/SpoVE family cell cycle protein [Bacteroidales bacterium]